MEDSDESSRRTKLLLAPVFLLFATVLPAADEGMPLVTDFAGTEKWIDGPDDVLLAEPRHSDVAVDNEGRRIHVWAAFGVDRLDIYLRRFDWAFTQSANAAAALASLLGGLYPKTYGLVEADDQLVDEAGTLPETLGGSDMTSAAFLTSDRAFERHGLEQGFEVVATEPGALD